MSVLEAIACGTPVILTQNSGLSQYFEDKVSLVVEPYPNELGNAIIQLLQDEAKQDYFRQNTSKMIEPFEISRVVCQLEEMYKSIVG